MPACLKRSAFLSTLREVVEHYNVGGVHHEGLDPAIRPLGLEAREVDNLVAFLNSLTADNIDELIQDARSERVGNPGDIEGREAQ